MPGKRVNRSDSPKIGQGKSSLFCYPNILNLRRIDVYAGFSYDLAFNSIAETWQYPYLVP